MDAIIVLAWPKAWARQINEWYDPILKLAGINKNGYYRAGHAAAVLVDGNTGNLHYFDFGRYHSIGKEGRVRNMDTDPDVEIYKKATFNTKGHIDNLFELLFHLSNRTEFHGEGVMYASVNYGISFQKAYDWSISMQDKGLIPYGPFRPGGTNCSRFVNALIRAGKPGFFTRILLHLPFSLTPLPLTNVITAGSSGYYYTIENDYIHTIYSWLGIPLPGKPYVLSVTHKKRVNQLHSVLKSA